jgi:hypothetical protein
MHFWIVLGIIWLAPLGLAFLQGFDDLRIYSDSVTYLVAADNFFKNFDFIPPTSRPTGFTKAWAFFFSLTYSGQAIVLAHTFFLVFSVSCLAFIMWRIGISLRKILFVALTLEMNPQAQYYVHTALAESFSYSLLILALSFFLLRGEFPRSYLYSIILSILLFGGLVIRYYFLWMALLFSILFFFEFLLDRKKLRGSLTFTRFEPKKRFLQYFTFGFASILTPILLASFVSDSQPTELVYRPIYASSFTGLAKVAPLIDCKAGEFSTPIAEICVGENTKTDTLGFDQLLYDANVQAISNINPDLSSILDVSYLRSYLKQIILSNPKEYVNLISQDLIKILNPNREEYIGRVNVDDSPYSNLVDTMTNRKVGALSDSDVLFQLVTLQTFLRVPALIFIGVFRRENKNLLYFYLFNLTILAFTAFPTPRYVFPLDSLLIVGVLLRIQRVHRAG